MVVKLMQLNLAERIQLVEDLWDAIAAAPQAAPVTDAQKAELDRRLDAALNDAERAELESYLQLEHFVRRLKIRAREKLAAGA